jgi:hypothetical protein
MRQKLRAVRSHPPEIEADPFDEHAPGVLRSRRRLLGADFVFECGSSALARLVDWAYAGLPEHTLDRPAPRLRVALMPAPEHRRRALQPPPIEMLSGAGFLGGTTCRSDLAVLSADCRAALVVVSREMLRSPYHARYELLEFAVFTLASRTQGLVSLHAACIGLEGRGLLLLGDSGAGKSTASLHCLLRGLDFVSEDSVFVAPDTLLVTGVANFLHIARDSLRFLSRSDAAEIRKSPVIRRRSGVQKLEIDLRQPRYRLATSPLKLSALVFISARSAHDGPLLVPLRKREALARLEASQAYAAGQPGWRTFTKRLASVQPFELLRGSHPVEAADVLQELLTGYGVP